MNKLVFLNVNKHYKSIHALKNFSFSFDNGVYGIIGPNGAGKSTLLNLLSSNLQPDKDGGEILWNNNPIDKLGKEYRKKIGFMPQQQDLYSNMTAFDFLGYMAALKNITRKQIKPEISRVLSCIELSEFSNKKIGEFSGGMKQRLLIAQALLGDPDIIIMDEPTAGLDPKQRIILRNLTEELSKNKIIIVSTHIISDIESIANEILLLRSGTLITHGSIECLVNQIEHEEKNLENLYMKYFGGKTNAES